MNILLERVPITTVSGFLGAGKTTLVNHLLRQAKGKRIAVFVNDFGAIDIDSHLIETVEENRISLKNGCVCCTLNDDLVAGIAQFAKAEKPPDAIVIEASGVSDPRSLDTSLSMLENAGLARVDVRLHVIDANLYHALQYADQELLLDHVAVSDLVLVNKIDITTNLDQQTLLRDLDEAAPFTAQLKTFKCEVDPSILTGPSLSSRSGMKQQDSRPSKNLTHRYESWSIETTDHFCREKFFDMLIELPKYCLRAKGFVRFSISSNKMHLFNLVGTRADVEACNKAPQRNLSQMVFIGPMEKFDSNQVELLIRSAITRDKSSKR